MSANLDLAGLMNRQQAQSEIHAICRQLGAGFVIDTAREFVEANEKRASAERERWRDEMRKLDVAKAASAP